MANSFQTHTGNGVTATFSWSQIDGFLSSAHIYISVNGLVKTAGTHYTLNTTARTVTFTAGNIPANLAFIKVQRITPKTEAGLQTVFVDGSVTTAADLNAAQRQQLYIAQEAQDTGSGALPLDENGEAWDAQAKRISSVAAPLDLEDAATKGYVDSIALFGAYTVPQSWSFNGTGSQTAFVLSSPEPTATDARMFLVEVNGVLQRPLTNYNIVAVGSTYELQLDAAPSAGTGNIVVRNFGVARSALDVIPNSSITNQYLAADSVTTVNIQDLAVTAAKLANLAVETAKLADNAVTALKLAANSVETAKIANEAVTTAKIADTAVDTAKIADLAITAAKMANGAVEASKIALAAVDYTKFKTTGFTSAGAANRMMAVDASGNLAIPTMLSILQQFSLNALAVAPTADIPMNNRTFSGLLEGTFTPRFLWGGNAVGATYSTQFGRYLKIGKLVFVSGRLVLTARGSSTGNAEVADLPFPCASSGWSGIHLFADTGWASLNGFQSGFVNASDSNVLLYHPGGSGSVRLTNGNFTNTTSLIFSGCYLSAT
jgi:hypothetical protein